jgi:hypothetical protein
MEAEAKARWEADIWQARSMPGAPSEQPPPLPPPPEPPKTPKPKKPKTLIKTWATLEWERRWKKARQGKTAATWVNPWDHKPG